MSFLQDSSKNFISKHKIQIKFVIVGIWNTIFGYGIFLIFYTLFSNIFKKQFNAYMLATVLGNFLAITNAFIFHKYITFRSKVKGWKILSEYFRFCLTYAFTFLVSLIFMPISVEILSIPPRIAAGLVIMICMIVSYIGHSRFSFPIR